MKTLASPPHFMPRSSPGDGAERERLPRRRPPRHLGEQLGVAARPAGRRRTFGVDHDFASTGRVYNGSKIRSCENRHCPVIQQIVQTTPLAVVCDFDGTATLLDIGDEISRRFGGEKHFLLQKELFAKGELNTRGIIEGIYAHVVAPESEICAFAVEAARLRPGFVDLIAAA